jgi:hypothetical protein
MEFVPSVETRLLYDRLKPAVKADVITYEELSALIGQDVTNGARHLLTSARRLTQKEDRKVFGVVRGVGLKCLTDTEIANSGEATRKSLRRKATREGKKLECVEFDTLNGDDKVKHQVARTLVGFIYSASSPAHVKEIEGMVSKTNTALTFAKTLEAFKK